MALTRFNYQPGQYETCTDETLIPASPVLNTWYNFEIGDWKHALSDVVLKQSGVAIPTSAYELAIDTKYTAREVGESGKTVYAKWRIVNATYDEIATTVTGNNFGTYIDNAKLDSRLDALEAFDAALDAGEVPYDNSTSGLTATDTQAAIDEIQGDASKIDYDNATSGLAATDVQAAIDKIVGDCSVITYDNATSGLTATDVKGALDEISGKQNVVFTIIESTVQNSGAPINYDSSILYADLLDFSLIVVSASGSKVIPAFGGDGGGEEFVTATSNSGNTRITATWPNVGSYITIANSNPVRILIRSKA
jgi:hypothetical protein